MSILSTFLLSVMFLCISSLYSAVGHAGASGYLAAMALMGVPPELMKPTVLMLNIIVAVIASIRFYRAKCFSWSLFWPFAIGSVPFAFIGGQVTLQSNIYKIMIGLLLVYASLKILYETKQNGEVPIVQPGKILSVLVGSGIGLMSGLIGVGGGIFLSPILLLMRWADARHTAGVSAVFILLNSISGLTGMLLSRTAILAEAPVWAIAVILGGYIGSEIGSNRLGNIWIRRILAMVLIIAALKMVSQ